MAPRKRSAAAKKEATQVLPGRLGEKEQRELAERLVDKFGGRQSKEAGIDLEGGGDAALEQWFLLAALFSRGVSAGQVVNTYKVLSEGGVKNVSDAGDLEYQALWDKLTEGKAQRRDRTTKQLQSLDQVLKDKYGGSVSQLLASSQDAHEIRANIEALPSIGPTTAELFLRDLRELYPQVKDALDISDRALEGAQHLGLVSKIVRTNKRQKGADSSDAQKVKATDALEEVAKTAGFDCRDLETALIKLHNEHYRKYSKCPGGLECTALQIEGGGKEQGGEEIAAQAEEAPAAGGGEEKAADVSMEDVADVSKEKAAEAEEDVPAVEEAQPAVTADEGGEAPADVSKAAEGAGEEKEAAADGGSKEQAAEDEVAEKGDQGEDGGSKEQAAEEEVAEKGDQGEDGGSKEQAAEEEVVGKSDQGEDGGSKEKAAEEEVAEKGDHGGEANGEMETEAPAEDEEKGVDEHKATKALEEGAQPEDKATEKAEEKDAPNGAEPKQADGPEVGKKEAPSDVPRLEDDGGKPQTKGKDAPQAVDAGAELKAGA